MRYAIWDFMHNSLQTRSVPRNWCVSWAVMHYEHVNRIARLASTQTRVVTTCDRVHLWLGVSDMQWNGILTAEISKNLIVNCIITLNRYNNPTWTYKIIQPHPVRDLCSGEWSATGSRTCPKWQYYAHQSGEESHTVSSILTINLQESQEMFFVWAFKVYTIRFSLENYRTLRGHHFLHSSKGLSRLGPQR